MELASLLPRQGVFNALQAGSKRQVLQQLSERAAELTGLSERAILCTLMDRERLGSTAMGNGIAIPHGRFNNLHKIVGLFARLETPVDFDAPDDKPVDLVFVLLVPAAAHADHLKALARVSRMLRDPHLKESLRAAVTSDNIHTLLTHQQEE